MTPTRKPVPPPRPRRHRGRIAVAVIVALALVAGAVYWFGIRDTSTDVSQGAYHDIGSGVGVSEGAPDNIKAAADNAIAKPQIPQTEQSGSVVHITPDGPLGKPVTLRFKLTHKVNDPRDIVLAVNQTGKADGWMLVLPSKVEGEYAYYTTTHLSWWDPLWHDFTELVNAATAELKKQWDGLTDDAFAEAEQTKCNDEQAARDKGYSIKWSGAEALYWCLGLDHDKPVVRIANKRSYPIFVNHMGIAAPDKPKSKFDLELLGRQTFSDDRTVLMATDQLQLNYELEKGQSKTFTTEYNGFAESLYQLQFGVTTLLNILTRYGAGSGGKVAETMAKVLQDKDCVTSVNTEGSVGQVINACLDPAKIIKIFGWQGVLVAMVMIAAPVVKFFRNTFDTLGDLLQGKDRETVTVSYNPPERPKVLFPGTWRVHGIGDPIVIDDSLVTTYTWNAGPCPTPNNEFMMCGGHASVMFKVTGPDVMTGTYTKVWYTTNDGQPAPNNLSTDSRTAAGLTFTVKRNDEHTLITSDGTGNRPGNPYLCDNYAEMHNGTTYQLCGA